MDLGDVLNCRVGTGGWQVPRGRDFKLFPRNLKDGRKINHPSVGSTINCLYILNTEGRVEDTRDHSSHF